MVQSVVLRPLPLPQPERLVALGSAGLFAVRRTLTSELYGLSPFEPSVLAAAAVLLSLVALSAWAVPARRAAGIDPVVALSAET